MDAFTTLLDVALRLLNVVLAVFLGAVLIGAIAIVVIYGAMFVLLGGAS